MDIKVTLQNFSKKMRRLAGRGHLSHEAVVILHWKILLASLLCVIVGLFAYGTVVYRDVGRGDFFSTKTVAQKSDDALGEEVFKKVIANFATHDATAKSFRDGHFEVVDPLK